MQLAQRLVGILRHRADATDLLLTRLHRPSRGVDLGSQRADQLRRFAGGACGFGCQRTDFFGHDREALPVFLSLSGLDRRVESQQVRLARDP